MAKKVLLIGGKSKTKVLALSLLKQGYRVTIINENYDDCMELAELKGVSVLHGDATKPFILDEADAASCDFSIALTSSDEYNLAASELCKKMFHVRKTVSLLSDPAKKEFFYQMGVDSVVCATQTISSIIEQQAFLDDLTTVIPIGSSQMQIVEVRIAADSPVIGKNLSQVSLQREATIGCIMRDDGAVIPHGDTQICEGDTLVVILNNAHKAAIVHALTGR